MGFRLAQRQVDGKKKKGLAIMRYEVKTLRGYDLFEVASALQKSLRRGDIRMAGYWVTEMGKSGFGGYAWKRLLTVAAEDCHGIICHEILALCEAWERVTKGKKRGTRSVVFLAKAAWLLAVAKKNRDSDHLINLTWENKMGVTDDHILKELEDARSELPAIPDEALDLHTRRGKARGATKDLFLRVEQAALSPKEPGILDADLDAYVKDHPADDPRPPKPPAMSPRFEF